MKMRINNMLARAGSAGSAGPGRGFTLIELLIAVGALAFVAVGIAAIFEATGRTIQGGKRVSAFGNYASLIERQMRADIASMTRDGFMVIRCEMADADGDGEIDLLSDLVPLADGDGEARPRRIDEIMFFSKGQFVSMREALHASLTARSDSARIYYGHGKRGTRPNAFIAGNVYYTPDLNDSNDDPNGALGYLPSGNAINPNRFASDWTLLRHVTLLSPPESSPRSFPPTSLLSGLNAAAMADSDTQIALQPAASNLFRALNALFPTGPGPRIRTDALRPFFTSGIVDITTTSLPEIRAIVTTADTWPGGVPSGYPGQPAGFAFFDPTANAGPDGTNAGVDGVYRRAPYVSPATPVDPAVVARSQAWMADALPGWSTASNTLNRTRIRCEPKPTNYVGSLVDATGPWSNDLDTAIRRADQVMLSSSNFLPRCTEFIVEWSFGHVWTSDTTSLNYDASRVGELVWYGMPRQVNGKYVAVPYGSSLVPSPSAWVVAEYQSFRKIDGTVDSTTYAATDQLIHGAAFNATRPYDPLVSYFGYTDPRFNPDGNGDGKLESGADSISPTIQWPWPKLIRVTLSLADPNDPTIERTFQFVFEVPAAPES